MDAINADRVLKFVQGVVGHAHTVDSKDRRTEVASNQRGAPHQARCHGATLFIGSGAETAIKRATANITGGRQGAFQPSRPAPIGSISVSRAANPEISFTEYADPFWQIAIGTKTPSSFEPMLVQAFGAKTRITAGLKLMPGDMFSLTLGEYRSCTVSWSALSLPTRSA